MAMPGIGLGLDFGSAHIAHSPANTIPGMSNHPAYSVHPPTRSHRGPRSMGVGKRFVSAPAPTLPPTLYDRTPLNPLSLSNPINSPQLDIGLAHISPAKHLRQVKKRSIATRNLGLGLGDTQPIDHVPNMGLGGEAAVPAAAAAAASASAAASSSPTIAASPTMAASALASPIVSSPVPDAHAHGHDAMMASSIALSVVLGFLVLGLAGWTTYRRRLRARMTQDGGTEDEFDATHQNSKTFAASNVVEKGLRTKPRSSAFISSIPPAPRRNSDSYHVASGRRVSFIDTDAPTDQEVYAIVRGMSRYSIAPPRVMTATLFGHGEEDEDEMDVADARSHGSGSGSGRHSCATSIAPSLEPIEEEGSLNSFTSDGDLSVIPASYAGRDLNDRPVSVASTACSSTSSSTASAYTTASARSSISSLSALSIISSAFPQTPRELHTPSPPCVHPAPHGPHSPASPSDSPTPASKFLARRARAQSQTVVSVKHVDMLRTAVGRTMSLQPSKEVINALKRMTAVETDEAFPFEEMRLAALVVEKLEADARVGGPDRSLVAEGDVDVLPHGVAYAEDSDVTADRHRHVSRSTSSAAKIDSRRRAQSQSTSHSPSAPLPNFNRRSEVISGAYFKRALRSYRQAENGVPAVPSSIPIPMPMSSRAREEAMAIAQLAERQAQLEAYLSTLHEPTDSSTEGQSVSDAADGTEEQCWDLEDRPFAPASPTEETESSQEVEEGAFDEYYLHFEDLDEQDQDERRVDGDENDDGAEWAEELEGEEDEDEDDEEEEEEETHTIEHSEEEDFPLYVDEDFGMAFPLPVPSTHLPHIRVTSH